MEEAAAKNVSIPEGLERSVVVRNPGDVAGARGARRIYFGDEFCDRLIPTRRKIEEIIEAASGAGREVSFLTPVCTDEGLKKLKPLLKLFGSNLEVVVNDWGVMALCGDTGIPPVLGRLLTACCRDPRFAGNIPERDSLLNDYIRSSSMSADEFQDFLIQNGITRIELDNVVQFYNFRPLPSIRASLHFPYVYTSTTRRCLYPFAHKEEESSQLGIEKCGRECRNAKIVFSVPKYSLNMLIKGNTQFYGNGILPEKRQLRELNIDRIVMSGDVS